MHVKTKDLPNQIRDALKRAGHTRPDIEVIPADTVDRPMANKGERGLMTSIHLPSGKTNHRIGSWGGATPNEHRHLDHVEDLKIPENWGVWKGVQGYKLSGYGRLYVNPKNIDTFQLTDSHELTDNEKNALICFRCCKPFYRGEWLARHADGIEYNHQDPTYIKLARLGLVKVSKNGAMRITTEGKNAI